MKFLSSKFNWKIVIFLILPLTTLLCNLGFRLSAKYNEDSLTPKNFDDVGKNNGAKTFLERWEEEIDKRRNLAKMNCRRYQSMLNFREKLTTLLWQPDSHLSYCRQAKAGSSTMVRTFYELANLTYDIKNAVLPYHRAPYIFLPPENGAVDWNNTVFIVVVRHPHTRLISAYKDKLHDKEFLPSVKRLMINTYRNKTTNFEDWRQIAGLIGTNLNESPTVWEFLMYIIEKSEDCMATINMIKCLKSFNSHWKQYFVHCSPCSFDYNVIGKIETMKNDMEVVAKKVSEILNKTEEFHRQQKGKDDLPPSGDLNRRAAINRHVMKVLNKSCTRHEHKGTEAIGTTELTKRVWKLLTEEEKRRLREVYYFDFLLFGYDPYEFD